MEPKERDMKGSFLKCIYKQTQLNHNELELIIHAHTQITFDRGQLLLEKGKCANDYPIIESGLVRAFTFDYKEDEITTNFIGTQQILIEVSSLF